MRENLIYLSARARFILGLIKEEIVVKEKTDEEVEEQLVAYELPKKDDSYDYLVNMPIKKMTKAEVEKLKKEVDDLVIKINTLDKTSIQQLYLNDLDALTEYF